MPTAVNTPVGNGVRRGILVKAGSYLDANSEVDTVCFDKAGTLTEGQPTVQQVRSFQMECMEDDILQLTARAEVHSQHPLPPARVDRHPPGVGIPRVGV